MKTGKKRANDIDDNIAKKARALSDVIDDGTIFCQLLNEAGVVLKQNGPVELNVVVYLDTDKDGVIVQRNLARLLKHHAEYPQVVTEFVDNFSKCSEDQKFLRVLLLPTVTASDATDVTSRAGSQDSLIRLMLGIEILQPPLMSLLVEKLIDAGSDTFVQNDRRDGTSSMQRHLVNGESLTKLIINQFRWLDRIVNAEELVGKMFEVLSVAPVDVQKEIISCLPEIVDDSQHTDVTQQLRDLVLGNRPLLVNILDVLTNLNLTPELLAEVREAVIQIIPSAVLDDLPVIVDFLLSTCTAADIVQVVGEIRASMDLASLQPVTSTPHETQRQMSRGSVALILNVIRSACRFKKFVADAWIKVIEGAREQTVLDVLVLVILHSCGCRKQSEALFRSRIISGHFTEALLKSVFTSHAQVLREYFSSVLSLAEVLLRSVQSSVSAFSAAIYREAFVAFDSHCQQEVVGNLVTHIGCGIHSEVQASLDIFLDIVYHHTRQMAPFSIFIKGVLDYLDNLDMSEIRKLYSILGCLAFEPKQSDSILQDALHMIIRKQLSNPILRYQQMGVIGAIMIVMNMAKVSMGSDVANADSIFSSSIDSASASLTDDTYSQVIALLELVKTSSNRSADASALFMQELADVVRKGRLHGRVEEWIAENVINEFQEDFVIDVGPGDEQQQQRSVIQKSKKEDGDAFCWSYLYALDPVSTDGSIALNILPLLQAATAVNRQTNNSAQQSNSVNTKRSVLIWCLPYQFRLLQICESRQHSSDLEGIDALLGCPVKLPSVLAENGQMVKDKVRSLTIQKRHLLTDCLFLTINWFREVVNAFASQTDPELSMKVIRRLADITRLQELLLLCLADLSDYLPPPAINLDSSRTKPLLVVSAPSKKSSTAGPSKKKNKNKKKTKPKKGKKKVGKSKDGSEDDEEGEEGSNDEKEEEEEEEEEDKSIEESRMETEGGADMEISHLIGRSKNSSVALNPKVLSPFLKELDMEVFCLLKFDLTTSQSTNSKELTTTQGTQAKKKNELGLDPAQLLFLLDDLVIKLDHILISATASTLRPTHFSKARGAEGNSSMFHNLTELGATSVARQTVQILPFLCRHLESSSAYFQAMLALDDGVIDGPRSNTDMSAVITDCLERILHILLTLYSWSGFTQQTENRPLLITALSALSSRLSSGSTSQIDFSELVKQSYNYCSQLTTSVPSLGVAVTQCRLLACLVTLIPDCQELKLQTGELALSYLRRDWLIGDGLKEKGAAGGINNEHLQTLLLLSFSHSDQVETTLLNFVTQVIPELTCSEREGDEEGERGVRTYPTLTKRTYPVFYRAMLHKLVDYVKTLVFDKLTVKRRQHAADNDDDSDLLTSWSVSIKVFQSLVNLTKTFDARSNLGSLLKCGRLFIEAFLRFCMPLLDDKFRGRKDQVLSLLKTLQLATRSLHHVCGHSKIMKDVALTNQVPRLKRSLEVFVYRVKAMLTINQCLEAFWLGNLKNRDLKGEEIISQVSRHDDSSSRDTSSSDSDLSGGDDEEEKEEDNDENDPMSSVPAASRRSLADTTQNKKSQKRKIEPKAAALAPKNKKMGGRGKKKEETEEEAEEEDEGSPRSESQSYSEVF